MHTIHGEREILGVTSLDDKLYVLRAQQSTIDVYSTTDFTSCSPLTVPGLSEPTDIASCKRYVCLYVSESSKQCIHKLQLNGSTTKWSLCDYKPSGLSVTSTGNLLIACRQSLWWKRQFACIGLLEVTGDKGNKLREIEIQEETHTRYLQHCVQLTTNQFVTCQTNIDSSRRSIGIVGVDGRVTRTCHAVGQSSQLVKPCYLAVDTDSQIIFVADESKRSIALLSPTLDFVRHITEGLSGEPRRLHFDPMKQRLYVGLSSGHVTVLQLG